MSAATLPLWPAIPDWSNGVDETLVWLTDVMQATATSVQQTRALRGAPRRGFAFRAMHAGDDARVVAGAIRALGAKPFLLPIYPDVQWLAAPLAVGAARIDCATDGYDFTAGEAVALWLDPQHNAVLTLNSIDAQGIVLANALTLAWPLGTRLYPLRVAHLADEPQASWPNDSLVMHDINALIDEPCAWLATAGTTLYRSVPVLEWRPNEAASPALQWHRELITVDVSTGPVVRFDLPGLPLAMVTHTLTVAGRAAHSALRSLLYWLAGRAGTIWVPSWQADVQMTAAVSAGATVLPVAACGFTANGGAQIGRRDLRIELYDGTVIYRRVTGSAITGSGESLQVDITLPALAPALVRQISWMTRSALASDSVKITHVTDADGVATCQLSWQAVADDV